MPPVVAGVVAFTEFLSTVLEVAGLSAISTALPSALANAIVIGGIMAGANAALGKIQGAFQGKPLDPGRGVNVRQ